VGEGLMPGSDVGTSKSKSKQEELLSQIIHRLNEIFITDGLSENDLLDYARTITHKVGENAAVMQQIRGNSADQAMLGDFAGALDNAVMESSEAHQNQMNKVLSNKNIAASFGRLVFDLLVSQIKPPPESAAPTRSNWA
jgi:type I restriction enzyme R subunit